MSPFLKLILKQLTVYITEHAQEIIDAILNLLPTDLDAKQYSKVDKAADAFLTKPTVKNLEKLVAATKNKQLKSDAVVKEILSTITFE